jgi:16S rRNA C967 or C1407 C5-methylase (RsmB/RsmF family)
VAQRQYALLTAALICTKPGGSIVYSTCSINNMENDDVIERLQKKKGGFQVPRLRDDTF